MKKKLLCLCVIVMILPIFLMVNGCSLPFLSAKEGYDSENGGDEIGNPDSGETEAAPGDEEEVFKDDYAYAGLEESEWNTISSKLNDVELKKLEFTKENAKVAGKRNRGLFAWYSNAEEKDYQDVIIYLKEIKEINFDETGKENGEKEYTYDFGKMFVAYTKLKSNKRYEYSVMFFNKDQKIDKNSFKVGDIYISIMECVESQKMTPLQYSQNWFTTKEIKDYYLEGIAIPKGMLVVKKETKSVNEYTAQKVVSYEFAGNEEHFLQLSRSIYEGYYSKDKNNQEIPSLEQYSSYTYKDTDYLISGIYAGYNFVDNIDYNIYLRYLFNKSNKNTGNEFSLYIKVKVQVKEEDKVSRWFNEEEKEMYKIEDVDSLKPNFGDLKDARYQLYIISDLLCFYVENVTKEQFLKYNEEKMFGILQAKLDWDDPSIIHAEFEVTDNSYKAKYKVEGNYEYGVWASYHEKTAYATVGDQPEYRVAANSMTISFWRTKIDIFG